jgi:hypothetical protein
MTFSVLVATLPAGELGETRVTAWNDNGVPTAATIVLSPDGAGLGWYVDSVPDDDSPFTNALNVASLSAAPGSAAFGRYDLLTAILHELGHVEGFIPNNPGFELHVQTTNDARVFVGPGVAASLVDQDQELDPSVYPNDLMSSTLAPGIRELPSALDVQILDAVNGYQSPPPVQYVAAPITTVVDHAIAAIAATSPTSTPASSAAPASVAPAVLTTKSNHKVHHVTIKPKHKAAVHVSTKSAHHAVTGSTLETKSKPTKHHPDATLARHLSKHRM